jgi:predicted lysophospholipase L1 biosynthesis ABC-type transport system permease subunit
MANKTSFAWLAVNEAIDDDDFYLEDSPELYEIEREELKKLGAPETDQIEFVSILAEDRDSAMVEAKATPAFIKWAKASRKTGEETTEDKNSSANLVWYS